MMKTVRRLIAIAVTCTPNPYRGGIKVKFKRYISLLLSLIIVLGGGGQYFLDEAHASMSKSGYYYDNVAGFSEVFSQGTTYTYITGMSSGGNIFSASAYQSSYETVGGIGILNLQGEVIANLYAGGNIYPSPGYAFKTDEELDYFSGTNLAVMNLNTGISRNVKNLSNLKPTLGVDYYQWYQNSEILNGQVARDYTNDDVYIFASKRGIANQHMPLEIFKYVGNNPVKIGQLLTGYENAGSWARTSNRAVHASMITKDYIYLSEHISYADGNGDGEDFRYVTVLRKSDLAVIRQTSTPTIYIPMARGYTENEILLGTGNSSINAGIFIGTTSGLVNVSSVNNSMMGRGNLNISFSYSNNYRTVNIVSGEGNRTGVDLVSKTALPNATNLNVPLGNDAKQYMNYFYGTKSSDTLLLAPRNSNKNNFWMVPYTQQSMAEYLQFENIENIQELKTQLIEQKQLLQNILNGLEDPGAMGEINTSITNIDNKIGNLDDIINSIENNLDIQLDILQDNLDSTNSLIDVNNSIINGIMDMVRNKPIITIDSPRETLSAASETSITLSGTLAHNHPQGATVTVSTDLDNHQVKKEYTLQSEQQIPWDITYDNLEDGAYSNIQVRATDNNGQTSETYKTGTVYIDNTPPTVNISGVPTDWAPQGATIRVRASDKVSGVKSIEQIKIDEQGNPLLMPATLVNDTQAEYQINEHGYYCFKVTDNVGNYEITEPIEIKVTRGNYMVDTRLSQTEPTQEDIEVTVEMQFPTGVALVRYDQGNRGTGHFIGGMRGEELPVLFNEGNPLPNAVQFTAPSNGDYTVYIKDNTGLELVEVISINNIDRTPPIIGGIQIDKEGNTLRATCLAGDNLLLHEQAFKFGVGDSWGHYQESNEYSLDNLETGKIYRVRASVRDAALNETVSTYNTIIVADGGDIIQRLREWLDENKYNQLVYPEPIPEYMNESEYLERLRELLESLGPDVGGDTLENAISILNSLIRINGGIQDGSLTINDLREILGGQLNPDYLQEYKEYLELYKQDLGRDLEIYDIQMVINAVNGMKAYKDNPGEATRLAAEQIINKLEPGDARETLLNEIKPVGTLSGQNIQAGVPDITAGGDIGEMTSLSGWADEETRRTFEKYLDGDLDEIRVTYKGKSVNLIRGKSTIFETNQLSAEAYNIDFHEGDINRERAGEAQDIALNDWLEIKGGILREEFDFAREKLYQGKVVLLGKGGIRSEPYELNYMLDWTKPVGEIQFKNKHQTVTSENKLEYKIDATDGLSDILFIKEGNNWEILGTGEEYREYDLGSKGGLITIRATISDLNGNRTEIEKSIWKI